MLIGLNGTDAYTDDIASKTQDELLNRLFFVFKRIQQYIFPIQAEKCQFFRTLIKLQGFIFDKNGRWPDPVDIATIKDMQAPINIP